jgi:hypothetical protein
MAKAKASSVAGLAAMLTKRIPPIPYVLGGQEIDGLDCQGYVEYCVNNAGGKMNYAGSNDMYRNAGKVYTLSEAKRLGYLVPAAGLLIVKQDNDEPDRYKKDGLGNASHVGYYLNMDGVEVGHASASKNCVTQSTLRNGWTHVILFDDIDYSEYIGKEEFEEDQTMAGRYRVEAEGGLRMRATPSPSGKYMRIIPDKTVVEVTEIQNNFGKIKYKSHTGWCSMTYLKEAESPVVAEHEADDVNPFPDLFIGVPSSMINDLRAATESLEAWMKKQIFGVNANVRNVHEVVTDILEYIESDD